MVYITGLYSPPASRPPRPPDPPAGEAALVVEEETPAPAHQPSHQMDASTSPAQPASNPPVGGTAWSTSGAAHLRETLATEDATSTTWTAELRRLYQISTATYALHADSALRPMSEEELKAMDAYVSRRLELPAPPTFLSCTATGLKRAALLAYHQDHVEATLIADVPASVRLGKNIPRLSILRELTAANAGDEEGRRRMRRFIKAAQRISYDGDHTLSIVFMSKREAGLWDGAEFKLRGSVVTLNFAGEPAPGVCTPPRLAQYYALRVLGTEGLNALLLMQVFGDIAQAPVLDVRHPGLAGLSVADNDYWVVIFSSRTCPAALRGITSIALLGTTVRLHHFQYVQNAPCRRCLNPAHVLARCRVAPDRLEAVRANRHREYVGAYAVASVPRLPDCRNLAALDTCLSALDTVELQLESDADTRTLTQVLRAVDPPAVDPPSEPQMEREPDASGMTVIRRRRGGPRLEQQAPRPVGEHTGDVNAVQQGAGPTIGTAVSGRRQPAPSSRRQIARQSGQTSAAQRYRQTRAVFEELAADSDSDDEATARPVESPAASVHPDRAVHVLDQLPVQEPQAAPLDERPSPGPDDVEVAEDVDMDAADNPLNIGEALSPGGAPLGPTPPQLRPARMEDIHASSSETQPSREPFWHDASLASPTPMDTDEIVADTAPEEASDSGSDGFEIGDVVAPPSGQVHSVQEWIGSLHGAEVNVPANGQCLFSALHASMENTQVKTLQFSSSTISAINTVKKRVLDIVLANLRYDVKLGIIDPKKELRRLYPDATPPTSVAAAAAALYAHYAKARTVSVATTVPKAFWEGPHLLRAMAVYIREPIYVWDVAADNTAHVQQYVYKTFDMPNGDRHESGVVEAIPDDRARDILEECLNQHVIPVMLLLKHTEGHFYGVQHGPTFLEWHAQRGPAMRERLDTVHEKLGLPVLKSDGYVPASIADEAALEEQALLEEMGVDFYASGSQESAAQSAPQLAAVQRAEPPPSGRVHCEIYERILRSANLSQMDAIDSRLAGRLHQANDDAFSRWIKKDGVLFQVPRLGTDQRRWLAMLDWLCDSPPAMRHVLAYLPFPELAVQCCLPAQLARWGEREACNQQLQILERTAADEDSDDQARAFCSDWLDRCKRATDQDALDLARDRHLWGDLGSMIDASLLRLRPLDISLEHWYILHALPYAVSNWKDTAMGRAPSSAMSIWYTEYRQVRALCDDIANNRDWSKAVMLPLCTARADPALYAAQAAHRVGPAVSEY